MADPLSATETALAKALAECLALVAEEHDTDDYGHSDECYWCSRIIEWEDVLTASRASSPTTVRTPEVLFPGPTTYTEACNCGGWESGFHWQDCGVYGAGSGDTYEETLREVRDTAERFLHTYEVVGDQRGMNKKQAIERRGKAADALREALAAARPDSTTEQSG